MKAVISLRLRMSKCFRKKRDRERVTKWGVTIVFPRCCFAKIIENKKVTTGNHFNCSDNFTILDWIYPMGRKGKAIPQ